jgi:hypothetical protein
MSIENFKRLSEIVRAGRTDDEMMNERMTAHPRPEDMIITNLEDPRPRCLLDGRAITDPDTLRAIAKLTDYEVMEWLDNIEGNPGQSATLIARLKMPIEISAKAVAIMTEEEIREWLDRGANPEELEEPPKQMTFINHSESTPPIWFVLPNGDRVDWLKIRETMTPEELEAWYENKVLEILTFDPVTRMIQLGETERCIATNEGSFLKPVLSATLEKAEAKHRATPFYIPNGAKITVGEVGDMDPENRRAWSANMASGNPNDIE